MESSAAGGDPRPSPSGGASPPPPPPPPLRGWLAGLVRGAGRFLASVLGPDPPSPTGSDSSASGASASSSPTSRRHPRSRGEGHYGRTDPDDSMRFPSKNNQSEKEPVLKGYTEASLAIISDIEPKDAIMQLLMQETFSRSEGTKLMKIIQERVVDPYSDGAVDGDIALPISWKADGQPTLGYFSPNVSSHSDSSFPIHGHGFDNSAAADAVPTLTPASRRLFNHNADTIQSTVKRSYSVVRDTPEDFRRVRAKIDGNSINITKFKQVDVVRNCPGFSGDASKLLSDILLLGANKLAHSNIVSKVESAHDISDFPNKISAVPSQRSDSNSSLTGGDQKNTESTFFKPCPATDLKNGFPLNVKHLNDLIPFEQKMMDLSHQKHKDAACDDSGSVSKLMFKEDIEATPSLQMGLQLQNGLKTRRRKQSDSPRTAPKIAEPPAMGTRKQSNSPRLTPILSEPPAMGTRKQSNSPRLTPILSEPPAIVTRRKISDATVKTDPDYVPEKRPAGRPRKAK